MNTVLWLTVISAGLVLISPAFGQVVNEQTNMIYVHDWDSDGNDQIFVINGTTNNITAVIPLTTPSSIVDSGDFILRYENPTSVVSSFLEEGDWGLSDEVDYLNARYALPYDIDVVVEECGEANMFWDVAYDAIIVCEEMVLHIAGAYVAWLGSEGGVDTYTMNVVLWMLHRDVAHALIDVYSLPTTGKEENVADQFATWEQLIWDLDGVVDDAELYYNIEVWSADFDMTPAYWGIHALDRQRAYNLSCYIYGYNPLSDSIGVEFLPDERKVWCGEEWLQMDYAWNYLLGDYHKMWPPTY